MSENKPTPPNSVPEEDLSLHENFAPIIAENGLIRQPRPIKKEELDDALHTRIDTLQDLVQLRQAEKKEKTLPPQPVPQELQSSQELPPEHTFAISKQDRPQVDLSEGSTPINLKNKEKGSKKRSSRKILSGISTVLKRKKRKNSSAQTQTTPPEQPKETKSSLPPSVPEKDKKPQKALPAKKQPSQKPVDPQLAQQPPVPPAVSNAKQGLFSRRWPWVVILCFLFLGGITGLVPVEKIPFLRNVAYAMGFSKDDTARMSFLRALLTWTDKTIGLPGDWGSDEPSSTVLAGGKFSSSAQMQTQEESGLSGRATRYSGPTSLINIAALQQLQREKGRPLDSVRGAMMPGPGQVEAQAGPAQLRDDRVSVRTESTRVQGDVYFGEEAYALNRDVQDGYDSSKTLAKVKNPHIADGRPIDWLSNMAQKMVRATNSLAGIDRKLKDTKVVWRTDTRDVGDNKEHRDLYHAWITSRMSKYTDNNMLKKALADSSFLGADLPQMASNVLSFAGVQIDADSLSQDQEAWKEYLEFEKRCKEDLREGGGLQVDNAITDFNSLFHETNDKAPNNVYFPVNCQEALDVSYKDSNFYKRAVRVVRSACKSMQTGYESLQKTCLMQVETRDNRCDSNESVGNVEQHYEQHYIGVQESCKQTYCELEAKKHEGEDPPWSCEDAIANAKGDWAKLWPDRAATGSGVDMEQQMLKEIGGDQDYFPQIIKDQETETEYGYGHDTIIEGMKENANITTGN